LPVGVEAPAFDLESTAGGRVSLTSLLTLGRPVLLLFTTPDCEMCNELLPDVTGWREQFGGALTVAVISVGIAERNREKAIEHGLDRILVQERDEVFQAYGFVGTPSAVVVSTDRKIGSSLVAGADAVRSLARDAASGHLLAQ
jgi:peroxiredoxin